VIKRGISLLAASCFVLLILCHDSAAAAQKKSLSARIYDLHEASVTEDVLDPFVSEIADKAVDFVTSGKGSSLTGIDVGAVAQTLAFAMEGDSQGAAQAACKGVVSSWAGYTAAGAYVLLSANPVTLTGFAIGAGASVGTKLLVNYAFESGEKQDFNREIMGQRLTPLALKEVLELKRRLGPEEFSKYKELKKDRRDRDDSGLELKKFIRKFQNGSVAEEYTYYEKDGKKIMHGSRRTMHENGKLSHHDEYVHGVRVRQENFYRNGKPDWYHPRDAQGNFNGIQKKWSDNGALRWEIPWVNNMKQGTAVFYKSDGKTIDHFEIYKDDKKIGEKRP
jgi:antitoxin component YwqK of YwqJK toxin-antitoxin module